MIFGDIRKITTVAKDHIGFACGIDPEVKNKPYLFYLDWESCPVDKFDKPFNSTSTCVTQCPTENFHVSNFDENINRIKKMLICTSDVNVNSIMSKTQLNRLVHHKKCARRYSASKPMYGICYPLDRIVQRTSNTVGNVLLITLTIIVHKYVRLLMTIEIIL